MNTYLNSLVNRNRSEFVNNFDINWLNPYKAWEYQVRRDALIDQVSLKHSPLFKGTKPYYNQISTGCRLCGEGKWSCLFITNICNARCFYCPSPQHNDASPSTQSMVFNTPQAYAEYANFFDFEGISFSGGEPLLYFERCLDYLKAIRKTCNPNVYIWLYTNGILVDENKLKLLADNGLNEIRFDIGATNYDLDNVKKAKDIIPRITIEIPAVPEVKERLLSMIPEMEAAGVSCLNLHQLRMTRHNAKNFTKRGYTIIDAERPLVLESEIAALEIMNGAKNMNAQLGVNYCSFHFKNRFQKAGFRQRVASKYFPRESITDNGYVRDCKEEKIIYNTVLINDGTNNFGCGPDFDTGNYLYNMRIKQVFNKTIPPDYKSKVEKLIASEPGSIPHDPLLFGIWQHEYIESGLREL